MKMYLLYADDKLEKDYRLPFERLIPPAVGTIITDTHLVDDDKTMTIDMVVVQISEDVRRNYAIVEVDLLCSDFGEESFKDYIEKVWFDFATSEKIEQWLADWDEPLPKNSTIV